METSEKNDSAKTGEDQKDGGTETHTPYPTPNNDEPADVGAIEAARSLAHNIESRADSSDDGSDDHDADEDGEGSTLPEVVEPEEGEDDDQPYKVKTKYEGLLGRDEAVAYFESIVAGLKKGTIQFRQGDESLTLTPSSHVAVTIKGSRKGNKQKVSFKMSWRSAPESDLSITSDED